MLVGDILPYIREPIISCDEMLIKKNHNWQAVKKDNISDFYFCNKCTYHKRIYTNNICYSKDGEVWEKQNDFNDKIWPNFILLSCEDVNIKRLLE